MRRLVILQKARIDIAESINYLEENNLNAALELAKLIERKVNLLISFPYLGQAFKCGRFQGRCTVVDGYRIFYRVTEVEIEIVRVLHEKRDISRLL